MMKLSEAIRLGSMVHPQGIGKLRSVNLSNEVISTCALGAAYVASGLDIVTHTDNYDELIQLYPILSKRVIQPLLGTGMELVHLIYWLNDSQRWTREAIADWVQTIEDEAEVKTHEVRSTCQDEREMVAV